MLRTAIGAGLLLAALLTGLLAGTTRERPSRMPAPPRPAPAPRIEPVAIAPAHAGDPASGAAVDPVAEDGTPEAAETIDHTRRPPPELTPEQAELYRERHGDYQDRLHAMGVSVAGLLEGDRTARREAVERMRELRDERNRFLADLLGREAYGRWRHMEMTGGRSVDEFLRELQERNR